MDIGDHYVEVPAKNVLIEFYMQAASATYFDIPTGMMLGMFMVAFPYIWRALNGKPSFYHDD